LIFLTSFFVFVKWHFKLFHFHFIFDKFVESGRYPLVAKTNDFCDALSPSTWASKMLDSTRTHEVPRYRGGSEFDDSFRKPSKIAKNDFKPTPHFCNSLISLIHSLQRFHPIQELFLIIGRAVPGDLLHRPLKLSGVLIGPRPSRRFQVGGIHDETLSSGVVKILLSQLVNYPLSL
jgi:hypothetical protein